MLVRGILARSVPWAVGRGGLTAVRTRPISNPAVNLPSFGNEPNPEYLPGSPERAQLKQELADMKNSAPYTVPVVIGDQKLTPSTTATQLMPSDHKHVLANVHLADKDLIAQAIENAMSVKYSWARTPLEDRMAIFLKAADLLSTKYRSRVMAATMLGQGKNVRQAEIDAAAETIDFFRLNCEFATELVHRQPTLHSPHTWNQLIYRPLEGFVASIAPFNFTAIGANLAMAPALMGNVVLWKPSTTAALSNYIVYDVLREAGLPAGVINFVAASGPTFGDQVCSHPALAAINFTGSTSTFTHLWSTVATNLTTYRSYPRLVGEVGGKNFHFLHKSADIDSAANATLQSAFEYQGQKCSACSRVYVPESIWPEFRDKLVAEMKDIKVGQPDDFESFMCAVIDDKSFDRIRGFLERAKADSSVKILSGGEVDDTRGYFVQPTLVQVSDPQSELMQDEIFGPVVAVYVYPDDKVDETLKLVDETTNYSLTGSIFSSDRAFIRHARSVLLHSAGNIYINDKSTGAVVGQQPFGGGRSSGTNDKAGFISYLYRFTSIQAIKETMVPVDGWTYPHQQPEQ